MIRVFFFASRLCPPVARVRSGRGAKKGRKTRQLLKVIGEVGMLSFSIRWVSAIVLNKNALTNK